MAAIYLDTIRVKTKKNQFLQSKNIINIIKNYFKKS